ncbi:MAG TPA: hypothetical protein PLZ42_03045 [Methanothrix sp.]|nr:hypothetical protein [Methanothrix sp.]
MKELKNIDSIIARISDESLKTSLSNIKKIAQEIWFHPPIIKDFTNHGIEHSDRVAGYIISLIDLCKGKNLSNKELYLLAAGACLHDIGMQCDVCNYPLVVEKAKSLGAKFEGNLKAEISSEFSRDEQDEIRRNHHYLSAAWIHFASSNKEECPIDIAIKSVPPDLKRDLIDVCMYHSKLPIDECDERGYLDKTIRKRLIAAVLRFGDELDIAWNRVSDDAYSAFRFHPGNELHMWMHEHTHISIVDNSIEIKIAINPRDKGVYGQVIETLYIEKFIEKNQPVINEVIRNNITIFISQNSGVVDDDLSDLMPSKLSQLVFEQCLADLKSIKILNYNERISGKLYSLKIIQNKYGNYFILKLENNKKLYVPDEESTKVLSRGIEYGTYSILRTKSGYKVDIGPRFMDIGEVIAGSVWDVSQFDHENQRVFLGIEEIILPNEVGNQVVRMAFSRRQPKMISIIRTGSNYNIKYINDWPCLC